VPVGSRGDCQPDRVDTSCYFGGLRKEQALGTADAGGLASGVSDGASQEWGCKMRIVCAWCGCEISNSNVLDFTVTVGGVESSPVSHGICPVCFEKVIAEETRRAETERSSVIAEQERVVVI